MAAVSSAQVEPMTNDECSTAIPIFTGINPSVPTGVSGNVFTNAGSAEPLSAGSPGMCGVGANSDVWFTYFASTTGSHTFSTCTPSGLAAGTHTDTILQVLDASACPPTTPLGCDDDGCGFPDSKSSLSVSLTVFTTYFVRVASSSAAPDGTFYITVAEPPPPSNDECTTPIAVFDGINPNPPSGTSGTTHNNISGTGYVTPPEACTVLTRDVWFTYTAGVSGLVLMSTCTPPGFTPGTLSDTVLQVFDSATCPPTTDLGCNDNTCGTLAKLTIAAVASSTYLIRVGVNGTGNLGGTFYLTITPGSPPSNDDCSSPIAIVEGENGPFDNTFATSSASFMTPPFCASGGATFPGVNDLFFSYTAVCDGSVDIKTCDPAGFTGSNQNTQLQAHPIGDCPGPPAALLACNDDTGCSYFGIQSFISFGVTGGSTYLVRVASWGAGNNGTFKVTVRRHTASSSTVGLGCSDGGGAGPTLTIDDAPVLGSVRTLTVASAAPASAGLIFFSNVAAAPTPLAGGCSLYLAQGGMVFLAFIATDGTGAGTLTVTAPSDPALECLALTVQGVILPSPGQPSYQVTDGLGVVLGY